LVIPPFFIFFLEYILEYILEFLVLRSIGVTRGSLSFNVVHWCVLFLIVGAIDAHECSFPSPPNHIRVIALPSGTTRAHDNWMESRVMPIIYMLSTVLLHAIPLFPLPVLPPDCAFHPM